MCWIFYLKSICRNKTTNTKTYFRATLKIYSLREDCISPIWVHESLLSQDYLKINSRIEIPWRIHGIRIRKFTQEIMSDSNSTRSFLLWFTVTLRKQQFGTPFLWAWPTVRPTPLFQPEFDIFFLSLHMAVKTKVLNSLEGKTLPSFLPLYNLFFLSLCFW